MGTASIHEGVRRMRFSSLLDRTEAKELTQAAASELLGINVRTFQRWAERYEAEGDDGLVDRRMGRRSPRRAPEEELERMLGLFRDKYADFTVKHFHEQLRKRHGYVLGWYPKGVGPIAFDTSSKCKATTIEPRTPIGRRNRSLVRHAFRHCSSSPPRRLSPSAP